MKKILLTAAIAMTQLMGFAQDADPDPTFNLSGFGFRQPGGTTEATIFDVELLPNGQMLAGGHFFHFDTSERAGLIRLNSDGSIDKSFYVNFKNKKLFLWSERVDGMAVQSDAKIIIYGDFDTVDGAYQKNLTRLNSDGSRDASFNIDLTEEERSAIYNVHLRPDGKFYVRGTDAATTNYYIYRFFPDGTWDNSFFNISIGRDGLDFYADGKFLAVDRDVRRFNADGSDDNTFSTITGFDARLVFVKILPDGKFLVGGDFTKFQNQPCEGLARFNSNGSFDNTFRAEGMEDMFAKPEVIEIQNDGKILVGNSTSLLKRLHPDGRFDSSFNVLDTPIRGYIYCLAVQPDNRIMVGGLFDSYKGTRHHSLVRLKGNTTGIEDVSKQEPMTLKVFPNPANDFVNVRIAGNISAPFTLYIIDAMGRAIRQWTEPATMLFNKKIDVSNLPAGQYILRTSADKLVYQRFTVLNNH